MRQVPWTILGLTVAMEIAAVALSVGLEPAYDTWLYALYSPGDGGDRSAHRVSRRPGNADRLAVPRDRVSSTPSATSRRAGASAPPPQGWPAGAAGDWIATWIWLVAGLGGVLTFLLFPDGRALTRRWCAVGWIARRRASVLAIAGWSLTADRDGDFASAARTRSPSAGCRPVRCWRSA